MRGEGGCVGGGGGGSDGIGSDGGVGGRKLHCLSHHHSTLLYSHHC